MVVGNASKKVQAQNGVADAKHIAEECLKFINASWTQFHAVGTSIGSQVVLFCMGPGTCAKFLLDLLMNCCNYVLLEAGSRIVTYLQHSRPLPR